MTFLEGLRFAWTPSCLRLLLAAGADAGPVSPRVWAIRCGLPQNHLASTILECERLGGLKAEPRTEGLALHVQPVNFWRVSPKHEAVEWGQAWHGVEQSRMALVTESMSLAESMAAGAERQPYPISPESGRQGAAAILRNPEVSPCAAPSESGGLRDHGLDHDPDPVHGRTERACLNHDHGVANRISEKTGTARAERRALPADKARATELIGTYLHGLSPDNAKRWERRVHEDAKLVEFAIEEAAARRERLDSVAAYANRVYLSRVNLKQRA